MGASSVFAKNEKGRDALGGFPTCLRLCLCCPAGFSRQAKGFGVLWLDTRVVVLPGSVLTPHPRRLDRRARKAGALEQVEGEAHDVALHLPVIGNAAGVAERKIAEQEARDPAFLDDVSGRTDDHGGDAILFQMSRDQTHGLVTDRSQRNEQGDIHPVFAAAAENLRRIILEGSPLAVVRRHAEEMLRNRSDPAGIGVAF